MKKNFCIIGAGWYGLHLAIELKKRYNVTIFEKRKNIFLGSSGFNQFRAHEGFHYPRSSKTIEQIKKNSIKFRKQYGFGIKFFKKNIYAIAKENSLIDFDSYVTLIKQHRLNHKIVKNIQYLKNVEGTIDTNEGVILNDKIKKYFIKNLKKNIVFNSNIKLNKKLKDNFDYILDCTNNELSFNDSIKHDFILTISIVYKKINKSNIFPTTIMDGELPSLFPYAGKKNLWTLTHSKYTHIKKFKFKSELEKYKNHINKKKIIEIKNNMEKSLKNYYSNFSKDFKFTNFYFSQKCLPKNKSSERLIYFKKKDKVISYFSPKIQNIFSAEAHLKALLKNEK